MINFDIHNVTKIRPQIKKFKDFTALYLHLEGLQEPIRILVYLDKDTNVPMELLNDLGPVIENAKREYI